MNKKRKIETIFDHNPTDEELKRFGGKENFEWAKQEGIEVYSDPDDANYALGILFSIRNDKKRANEYWAKIQDRTILGTLVQDF